MEEIFLGWCISSGVYGKATPVVVRYQTWSEYCKQRGWNPEELKKKKLD